MSICDDNNVSPGIFKPIVLNVYMSAPLTYFVECRSNSGIQMQRLESVRRKLVRQEKNYPDKCSVK